MRPCCAVLCPSLIHVTLQKAPAMADGFGTEKRGKIRKEKEESVKQKTTEGGAQRTITGDKLGS